MATVICPSCGGENNVTKKNGQECIYCGTHLSAPQKTLKAKTKDTSEELPISQEIIMIDGSLSSKDAIEKVLREWLVNADNIPIDIFDHLTIEEIKWYYLPMLRFYGDVETSWSCNQIIPMKREIGEKPIRDRNGNIVKWEKEFEYYNEYIPKSGKSRGYIDILVPCAKTQGLPDELKSCYLPIDYGKLKKGVTENYNSKIKTKPSNAEVNNQFLDFHDKKILTSVAEQTKHIANKCSFGSFESNEICDEHLSYNQNLKYPTGSLYFIPFVYVVYSYKEDSFEWCFMQSPNVRLEATIIPEMNDGENPMLVMQEKFEKQRKQLSKRDLISLVVSFFIPPLFGALFYFLYTYNNTEKAKRRLNQQQGLVSLLFKLKRHNNLEKYGYKAELKHDNDFYNSHADENESDKDYIDDSLPSTEEGIEEFFAETDKIRKKALKRISGYWIWFIGIIVIVTGMIIGYNVYQDHIQEKALEEEHAILENEMAHLKKDWQNRFQNEFIGKEIYGTTIDGHPTKRMKIKVIDTSNLEYSIAEEDYLNFDYSNPSNRFKTISTKTVPYTIEVSRHRNNKGYGDEFDISVKLEFDNYIVNDLLGESIYHRNDNFADEFEVIEKSRINDVISYGYKMKKK